jgi:pimeloyl-ACP methyl ester carboxylesterase
MSFSTQWAWFNDRNPPLWESQYDATAAIMDRITLPSLIVWGRHDGILPVELADDAYERLGTPRSDKSIVIFEDSAHSPMFEQPDAFNRAVIDFIEANR